MALTIRKKGNKNFFHYPTESGSLVFGLSKLTAKVDGDYLLLVEPNGAKRGSWIYSEVSIVDDSSGGGVESFASGILLFQRLINLGYPAFREDGEVVIADLISSDPSNSITEGGDGLLFAPVGGGGSGQVDSVQSGTDITVDATDPENPIVNFTGTIGGQVDSVQSGTDITVDATDPENPIVNFTGTIGGQVDSVQSGTDITVDATDPENPIVNFTGTIPAQQTPGYLVQDFGSSALNATLGSITTLTEIVSAINTVGFTVTNNQLIKFSLLIFVEVGGVTRLQRNYYDFAKNNILGAWGNASLNGVISENDLILREYFVLPNFIAPPATSEYIDLGDIGASTIEDYINAIDPATITWENLLADGTTYYFTCVISGSEKLYQYVGSLPETVGVGGTIVLTAIDFDLLDITTPVAATSPAGTTTQIQYNEAGAFGASADLIWNDATKEFFVGNSSGTACYINLNQASNLLRLIQGNSNIVMFGGRTYMIGDNATTAYIDANGEQINLNAIDAGGSVLLGDTKLLGLQTLLTVWDSKNEISAKTYDAGGLHFGIMQSNASGVQLISEEVASGKNIQVFVDMANTKITMQNLWGDILIGDTTLVSNATRILVNNAAKIIELRTNQLNIINTNANISTNIAGRTNQIHTGLQTATLVIENPAVSDDISFGMLARDKVTIAAVYHNLRGSSTPSVDWRIKHALDRSAAGSDLTAADVVTTSTTTFQEQTAFSNNLPVEKSALWVEINAVSGTVDELTLTVEYYINS